MGSSLGRGLPGIGGPRRGSRRWGGGDGRASSDGAACVPAWLEVSLSGLLGLGLDFASRGLPVSMFPFRACWALDAGFSLHAPWGLFGCFPCFQLEGAALFTADEPVLPAPAYFLFPAPFQPEGETKHTPTEASNTNHYSYLHAHSANINTTLPGGSAGVILLSPPPTSHRKKTQKRHQAIKQQKGTCNAGFRHGKFKAIRQLNIPGFEHHIRGNSCCWNWVHRPRLRGKYR